MQLRYQKCLDAHGGAGLTASSAAAQGEGGRASLGAALKSLVGSLTGRRPS